MAQAFGEHQGTWKQNKPDGREASPGKDRPPRFHRWVPGSWVRTVGAFALAIFLGYGAVEVFDLIARPLGFLVLGVTIAAALAPLVSWIEGWMPRVAAILLVYLVILLILVGLGWLVVPSLISQSQQLTDQVPQLINQAESWFNQFPGISAQNLLDTLSNQVGTIGSTIVQLPVTIATSLFEIFLVLVFSIYFLVDLPRIKGFIDSLFHDDRENRFVNILGEMGSSMGGYVRGSVIDGIVVGILTYFGMLLIGVPFPIVLGIFSGLMELVPTIGPVISFIPIVLAALSVSPTTALLAALFVVLLQQLEGHLLIPLIMGNQTNVSPLTVVIALFIGGYTAGLLGALVAIPIAAATRVFILKVVAPKVRDWTGVPQQEEGKERDQETSTA